MLLRRNVGEGYCGFPLRAEKGSTGNLGTHWFLALLEKHWRILLLQVGVGSQDLSWPESRIRAVDENDLLLNCVFSFQLASAQMAIFYFLFFQDQIVLSPNEPFTAQSHSCIVQVRELRLVTVNHAPNPLSQGCWMIFRYIPIRHKALSNTMSRRLILFMECKGRTHIHIPSSRLNFYSFLSQFLALLSLH